MCSHLRVFCRQNPGSGKIAFGKLSQALDYGAVTLQITGDFDACLRRVREVAASTGAACQSRVQKPSHVLTAMGLTPEESFSTVRFSLGRYTTEEEVDRAVQHVADAVANTRQRRAA